MRCIRANLRRLSEPSRRLNIGVLCLTFVCSSRRNPSLSEIRVQLNLADCLEFRHRSNGQQNQAPRSGFLLAPCWGLYRRVDTPAAQPRGHLYAIRALKGSDLAQAKKSKNTGLFTRTRTGKEPYLTTGTNVSLLIRRACNLCVDSAVILVKEP
ncbi:hypothetical protein BDV11DRAFT_190799 [Aspergillus similis]